MKPVHNLLIPLLSVAVFACNPVKQVLKDDKKTQAVVDSFLLRHPYKNDTLTQYLPGKTDTLAQYFTLRDTITEKVPCDTFTKTTTGGTTVKVDKDGKLTVSNDSLKYYSYVRTDTLKTLIKDRELLVQAQDLGRRLAATIAAKEAEIKKNEDTIAKLEKKIFWFNVKTGSLLLLLVLSIVWHVKRTIT